MKHKLLLLALIFAYSAAYAQDTKDEKIITGLVTSAEDGSSLPGVNVIVEGTSTGTVTDIDGKYSLAVPDGTEALLFRFLGFETKRVLIGGQSVIDVVLSEESDVLKEVVVTALGVSRDKQSLGYAVSSVGGEQVQEAKDANFLNSLSGKVAGVNIKYSGTMGGSTNVVVRGYTSIMGNNQALFVVDGTPISNENTNTTNQTTGRGGYDYGNAAMDVNPDDIESISVLKGAAATALYGSRGSNGVILITTKKGKSGQNGKKLDITFSSNVTFRRVDKTTLPVYQNEYGAGYGPFYKIDRYFNSVRFENNEFSTLTTADGQRATPFPQDASFGARFDPNLNVFQWNSLYRDLDGYGKATPWVAPENTPHSLFETGATIVNSLSLSTGNDKGRYRVSFTNFDQTGILPNSSLKRNTLAFSATQQLTDKLSATGIINYVGTKGKGRNGTGYDGGNLFQSFRQWYQVNVDIQEQKDAYFKTKKNIAWNPNSATNLKPRYFDNPYWVLYENFQTDSRDRYFGNVSLNYQFNDWLSVLGRVTYDTYNELQEERINVGSVDVAKYEKYTGAVSEYNYDLILSLSKDLTKDLNVDGSLGYNLRVQRWDDTRSETNGGLSVPGVYTLSNSKSPIEAPIEYNATKKVEGFFGRASLGYKEFAYLDLTYRVDRSSTLPENNNVYGYPSVSASFVFSNLIEQPWLSFGKFRVNYAEVGNDTDPYRVFNSYYLLSSFDGRAIASNSSSTNLSRLNNTDLKEERQKSYELGLEMNFFKNRVSFDISYYNSVTSDLLTPVDISNASGVGSRWLNAGSIENKGLELSLRGTPLSTANFTWDITVNWTKNTNKVIELASGLENLQLADVQGGITINAVPGQPYGTIRGSDYVYHANGGKIVKSNGAYQRTDETNKPIGDINPDWQGGIQNKFSYKGLSLSFLIDMQMGGDVFSLDTWYGYATGIYDITAGKNDLGNPLRDPVADGGGKILEGVKDDGTPNDVRADFTRFSHAIAYTKAPHAMHVHDASYVKLREVVFSYVLPQSIVDKLPFTHISASIIGRNLWIMHKNVPYSDPEAGLSSGNIQGNQSGAPPAVKQIGAALKLKF